MSDQNEHIDEPQSEEQPQDEHLDALAIEPGTIVAGYRIERELGQGAMAIVYLATQLNLERPVALKVLTNELARDEEFVKRFFNEAKAAGRMSHPNIIQAYDAGVAEGDLYYFAMEYVEGEDLETRIEREGYLRPSAALRIALDIARALEYGWRRAQLTHGDIKPENIMINKNGETRLADFGLAKVVGHHETEDEDPKGVMLTPAYASPEMIQGRKMDGDCRSDIYSFGATLYHMLAGYPPFPGDDAEDVMMRQINEPLTPLNKRNPSIDRKLSDFITGLLAKSPADRPDNWKAIVRVLQELEGGNAILTAAKSVKKGKKGKKLSTPGNKRARKTRRAPAPAPKAGTTSPQRTSSVGLVGALVFLAVAVCIALAAAKFALGGSETPSSPAQRPPPRPQQPRPSPTRPSPPADSPLANEWKALRTQCSALKHPAQRIELLDRFREKHSGQTLPEEFEQYYRDCKDALKWRRMTEQLDGGGNTDTPTKKATDGFDMMSE